MSEYTFEEDKQTLRTIQSALASAQDVVKQTKEAMNAEIKPYQEQIAVLKEQELEVRQRLTIAAMQNAEAAGQKTVFGVQLRETVAALVDPEMEAELCKGLIGVEYDGKPLVKAALNIPVLTAYAKACQKVGLALPEGISLTTAVSIALLSE